MLRLHRLILIGVLASGCGGTGPASFDAGLSDAGPPLDAPGFYRTIPAVINRDLDVLFVVDNSTSMLVEQQQLAANFPELVNALAAVAGGLPNLHLGVVSSNVGAAGAVGVPGCLDQGDDGNLLTGAPGNPCAVQFGLQGAFISDIAAANGTRTRNYTGDLTQLFTCMASLGAAGCGFEQHLESMYRALQPGKNPGFLRSAAHLALIILADEDDCSTQDGTMFGEPNATLTSALGPRTSFRCFEFGVRCDNDPDPRRLGAKAGCVPDPASPYMFEVQRYVDFMRTLKSGSAEVVVAGIAGDFDPVAGEVTVGPDPNNSAFPAVQRSCFTRDPNDPSDGATPPVRLHGFLSAFPGRNARPSICNDNLADALVAVGAQIKNAIGNPCIDAVLIDTDPNQPGLQPECTVHAVTDPGGPSRTARPVPACPNGTCTPGSPGAPCWCLRPDVGSCPASPGSLAIEVNRAGATAAPGEVVELFCRAE